MHTQNVTDNRGLVAQSVEQRIENARVGGSIPSQATTLILRLTRVPKLRNFTLDFGALSAEDTAEPLESDHQHECAFADPSPISRNRR